MSHRDSKTFKVELDSGKVVTCDVEVTGSHDPRYGEDADGNRGTPVWFVDEIIYNVPATDDDGVFLTEADKKDFEELIDKKANEHEWDFSNE